MFHYNTHARVQTLPNENTPHVRHKQIKYKAKRFVLLHNSQLFVHAGCQIDIRYAI